jgi:hypothetical protein
MPGRSAVKLFKTNGPDHLFLESIQAQKKSPTSTVGLFFFLHLCAGELLYALLK